MTPVRTVGLRTVDPYGSYVRLVCTGLKCDNGYNGTTTHTGDLALGGAVVRALDLRLEVAGSIPATALSSATSVKLFTYIVQRLWCYNLMALCK